MWSNRNRDSIPLAAESGRILISVFTTRLVHGENGELAHFRIILPDHEEQ